METINLFLIDMCHADNTSGVDRYMHTLIEGLNKYPHIKIHWINLRSDLSTILHKQENFGNYTKITIPLPQDYGEIISNKFLGLYLLCLRILRDVLYIYIPST